MQARDKDFWSGLKASLAGLGIIACLMTSLCFFGYLAFKFPILLQFSILSSSLNWLIILDRDIVSKIME